MSLLAPCVGILLAISGILAHRLREAERDIDSLRAHCGDLFSDILDCRVKLGLSADEGGQE